MSTASIANPQIHAICTLPETEFLDCQHVRCAALNAAINASAIARNIDDGRPWLNGPRLVCDDPNCPCRREQP